MPDETKAAEERLREAGWAKVCVKAEDWGYSPAQYEWRASSDAPLMPLRVAVYLLDREEAAEARGRARERADVVAWLASEEQSELAAKALALKPCHRLGRDTAASAYAHAAHRLGLGEHIGAAEREGE